VQLSADNITNKAGTIQGADVSLFARTDISNIGGTFQVTIPYWPPPGATSASPPPPRRTEQPGKTALSAPPWSAWRDLRPGR
jgi:adhesin HecA-like repeat protein